MAIEDWQGLESTYNIPTSPNNIMSTLLRLYGLFGLSQAVNFCPDLGLAPNRRAA